MHELILKHHVTLRAGCKCWMHISIYVLHNHIENCTYIMISTMDSSLWVYYISTYVQYVYVMGHSALSLSHLYVCCVMDTLANIYALWVVICMCLYRGGGGPVKIFAPPSIPVMVMCVILWQNEQTGTKQTNKQALGGQKHVRHQSEVNSVAMISRGECLNYLFYGMMKQREDCAVLQQGCLFACVFDCLSW